MGSKHAFSTLFSAMCNTRPSAVSIVSTLIIVLHACDMSIADVFGTGGNSFELEFVSIGSPANVADIEGTPSPAGNVGYLFRMAKHEISEDMVAKANTAAGLGITFSNRGANKPTTNVTWNEAAHFVNWLNTEAGFQPAYQFDSNGDLQLWDSADAWQLDGENRYRHRNAAYFIPSMNEWYKAAYFDPNSNSYYNFPTASDTPPMPVPSGTMLGTAVYANQASPADITLAGGLSPFGTMGQGGNVIEWQETSHNLMNADGLSSRGFRGGSWVNFSGDLASTGWPSSGLNPDSESNIFGFRVASAAVVSCDFDGNNDCDIEDLNALLATGPVVGGVPVNPGLEHFDLTGDGLISNQDVDLWLATAGNENGFASPYKRADANLDGNVDGQDFILWNVHKFTNSLLWNEGDFNGDGVTDGQDFLLWNENKFTSSNSLYQVPEPSVGILLSAALMGLAGVKRRQNLATCQKVVGGHHPFLNRWEKRPFHGTRSRQPLVDGCAERTNRHTSVTPTDIPGLPATAGGGTHFDQFGDSPFEGGCINRLPEAIVVRRSGEIHRRQFGATKSVVHLMALSGAWRPAK